jgi:hypothetical protein
VPAGAKPTGTDNSGQSVPWKYASSSDLSK